MPDITKISHGLTIGDLRYGNTKPGVVEATLKPGETMEQALDELDDRLNAWHRKRYPHLYDEPSSAFKELAMGQRKGEPGTTHTEITFGPPPVIDYGKHDASPEGVLADIKRCETLEELLTFKRIASADQTDGKELYTAYCQKLKELTPNTFTEGISQIIP